MLPLQAKCDIEAQVDQETVMRARSSKNPVQLVSVKDWDQIAACLQAIVVRRSEMHYMITIEIWYLISQV